MKFDEVAGGIVGFILGGLTGIVKSHLIVTKIVPKLVPEEELDKIIKKCEEECKDVPEEYRDIYKNVCIIAEIVDKVAWKVGLIGSGLNLIIIVPSIYQATKSSGFKKGFGYGLGIGDLITSLPYMFSTITTVPGRKELVSKMKMARKYKASLARSHVP